MAHSRPDVSVVVPVFQEEASIDTVVPRFLESLSNQRRAFELVFVNDGSRDRTGELLDKHAARDSRIRVIHFARNYGQTAAMMAGFWAARAPIIVPLDGDGQNEPDDVQTVCDELDNGYDVVSGWRKDRKDDWLRTNVSRCANWFIGKVTGVKLHDYGCTLKAYRAHMIRDARLFGEMHRFIPIYASMHGAKIKEVVVRHHSRKAGTSKYGYGRIVKVLLDILVVRMLQRYRTKPMHFFGQIAQWCWLAALACFVFGIARAIYAEDAWKAFWGKAPLVGLGLVMMGVYSIVTGLVAELVMRAGFEFNSGRYWEEARRVNFGVSEEREWTGEKPAGTLRSSTMEEVGRGDRS